MDRPACDGIPQDTVNAEPRSPSCHIPWFPRNPWECSRNLPAQFCQGDIAVFRQFGDVVIRCFGFRLQVVMLVSRRLLSSALSGNESNSGNTIGRRNSRRPTRASPCAVVHFILTTRLTALPEFQQPSYPEASRYDATLHADATRSPCRQTCELPVQFLP